MKSSNSVEDLLRQWYTMQHQTILTIFLPTAINTKQTLSDGGKGLIAEFRHPGKPA